MKSGMGLFAVLAEVDGAGIPFAYLFVDVQKGSEQTTAAPLATLGLLTCFLTSLKDGGFNPVFFGSDKDVSEIEAIQTVWPSTVNQLCYWHCTKAIRLRLKDSKKSPT